LLGYRIRKDVLDLNLKDIVVAICEDWLRSVWRY